MLLVTNISDFTTEIKPISFTRTNPLNKPIDYVAAESLQEDEDINPQKNHHIDLESGILPENFSYCCETL